MSKECSCTIALCPSSSEKRNHFTKSNVCYAPSLQNAAACYIGDSLRFKPPCHGMEFMVMSFHLVTVSVD